METTNNNALRIRRFATAFITSISLLVANTGLGDGIGGSGWAMGNISQFHSIVINGLHYETTNANVWVNGEPAELFQIEIGQLVAAFVDYDTLEALEVHQYDTVTGRVQEAEVWDETLAQMSLRVLDQDILVDVETVVHFEDPFKIKKDKYVTIGGLRTEDGLIRASVVEEAEDKHDLLVSGLVDDLDDDEFRIGDLTITSPYLAEYVQEGWLFEGAPVMVHGDDYKDGQLSAATIISIPIQMVSLDHDPGYAEIRIDGTIDSYDPQTGAMRVNDIPLTISEKTVLHDLRDYIRWFGLADIYPSDAVSVVAALRGGGLHLTKLVRLKKGMVFLRAPLQHADVDLDTLHLVEANVGGWTRAEQIRFGNKKIEYEELAELVRPNDAIAVEWKKDGKIKKLTALPDCAENQWQTYRERRSLPKEDRKALEKELKEARESLKKNEDWRGYFCFDAL